MIGLQQLSPFHPVDWEALWADDDWCKQMAAEMENIHKLPESAR
jgi:hypothetical protein